MKNIPNIIGNGNENPATKTQTQTLKSYKTDVVGLLKHRDTGISGIPENQINDKRHHHTKSNTDVSVVVSVFTTCVRTGKFGLHLH